MQHFPPKLSIYLNPSVPIPFSLSRSICIPLSLTLTLSHTHACTHTHLTTDAAVALELALLKGRPDNRSLGCPIVWGSTDVPRYSIFQHIRQCVKLKECENAIRKISSSRSKSLGKKIYLNFSMVNILILSLQECTYIQIDCSLSLTELLLDPNNFYFFQTNFQCQCMGLV